VHLELEKNTSDGDKFRIFATNIYPHFYDWKPMRSIFDILHKNFQEDQLNSSRFPGFPGVVDTLTQNGKPAGFCLSNAASIGQNIKSFGVSGNSGVGRLSPQL